MGRLTGETLPDSATVSSTYTFAYDSVGNRTSMVAPVSAGVTATTTYAFDSMNRLSSVTDPLGHVMTYSFDSAGNLIGVKNPLSNTTTYTFDTANRMTGTTIPISGSTTATTTYTLDAAGQLTAVTNPLNQTTTYSYTQRGLQSSVTDPIGNVTSYSYNQMGLVSTVTETDTSSHSYSFTYTYNAIGQVIGLTNPVAPTTAYAFDAAGNLTSVSGYNNGLGNFTYGYDALNRRTSQTDGMTPGDVISYAFDAAGNLTSTTDPLGHATTYSYDRQNRLLTVTDPLSHVTSYAYNLAGWKTSETDADSNVTSYAYNLAGLLTQTTNPSGYTATNAYDSANELTSATDYNGRQTTYSYNLAGWRTGETWVSGSYAAIYSYNAGGQLTGASDANSVYTYSYDSDGRVSQSKVSYPAITALGTVTLTYAYDGWGNRTSLQDSTGGTYGYSYNGNHQFTAIGLTVSGQYAPSVGFAYDSRHRLSNIGRSLSGGPYNSIQTTFTYDNANRVTNISHGFNSTNLGTFTYTYNAASQITNYSGPDGSLTYTYDNAGQLTGVSGAHNESFGFDSNGNRNTTGYTITTGNRMTADAAGNTLTYDHDGNLATKTDSSANVWTYTFDFHNRLTQVVEKNSGGTTILTENLTYDVNDNLISTSVNGTVQRWTVFDGKNPLLDFNASGTLTQRFVMDPTVLDRLFATVSASGTIDWLLGDNLDSTRVVTDVSGNVLDQITYGAFGNILSQTNSSNAPRFLYAGGEWDSNLSLYHFDARWTDPVDGRWISPDPLGLGPDSNPYRSSINSPTTLTDPTGLDPWGTTPADQEELRRRLQVFTSPGSFFGPNNPAWRQGVFGSEPQGVAVSPKVGASLQIIGGTLFMLFGGPLGIIYGVDLVNAGLQTFIVDGQAHSTYFNQGLNLGFSQIFSPDAAQPLASLGELAWASWLCTPPCVPAGTGPLPPASYSFSFGTPGSYSFQVGANPGAAGFFYSNPTVSVGMPPPVFANVMPANLAPVLAPGGMMGPNGPFIFYHGTSPSGGVNIINGGIQPPGPNPLFFGSINPQTAATYPNWAPPCSQSIVQITLPGSTASDLWNIPGVFGYHGLPSGTITINPIGQGVINQSW